MTIILNKKAVSTIAKAIQKESKLSYMQGLDLVAGALGYSNNATLMTALGVPDQLVTPVPEKPILLSVKMPTGQILTSIDMLPVLKTAPNAVLAYHVVNEWKSRWIATDIFHYAKTIDAQLRDALAEHLKQGNEWQISYHAPTEEIRAWIAANRPEALSPSKPEPEWKHLPELTALAYSDDPRVEYIVDARPHFWEISHTELEALQGCDWSGDYPSDAIYESACDAECPEALELRSLLDKIGCGYEVTIDKSEVIEWLKVSRPQFYETAKAILEEADHTSEP